MGLGEASFQSSWGGPSILQSYGFRKFGVPFRLINKDRSMLGALLLEEATIRTQDLETFA